MTLTVPEYAHIRLLGKGVRTYATASLANVTLDLDVKYFTVYLKHSVSSLWKAILAQLNKNSKLFHSCITKRLHFSNLLACKYKYYCKKYI